MHNLLVATEGYRQDEIHFYLKFLKMIIKMIQPYFNSEGCWWNYVFQSQQLSEMLTTLVWSVNLSPHFWDNCHSHVDEKMMSEALLEAAHHYHWKLFWN